MSHRPFSASNPRTLGRLQSTGFSLVELMVALAVFTMLGLGITKFAIHNQRSAQQNIMKNTAYTVAQGFAEQIKSLPESDLLAALNEPDAVPLPTRGISATIAGGTVDVEAPLFLEDPAATADGENYRQILIDLREDSSGKITEVFMEMWFDIEVTPMATSRGYLIEILFTYKHPALQHLGAPTNSIQMVRTSGAEN